jgi:hypothetical protein
MGLDLEEMLQALSKTLRQFDKTYICISALDECDEKQRGKLAQSLKQLTAGTFDEREPLAVKLFFTGRPQMKDFINSHPSMLSTLPVSIKLEASEGDIIAFIHHRIQEDTKVTMEEDFKNEIITNIVATSQGTLVPRIYHLSMSVHSLLLPALQIEAVLDKPTVRKRRQALKEMPRALYDAFGATIERIQFPKARHGKASHGSS